MPVEAIEEELPGTVTLKVDQRAVEGAPTMSNPRVVPNEGLQRDAHEHFGLGAAL